jgi:hypothetical protein
MPLLPPSQQINAQLADHAKSCALHLASAAVLAGRITDSFLSLSDEQLADWLNSQSPAETQALLVAHGQLGAALNSASGIARDVLTESGIEVNIPVVDVRPLGEKLGEQYRAITYTGGQWVVTQLPQPEVEPSDEQFDALLM